MRSVTAKFDVAGFSLALILHALALTYVYLAPPMKKPKVTTIEVEVRKPKPPPPPATPPEPPKPPEPEKPPEPPKKLVKQPVPQQAPKPTTKEPPKEIPKPIFGIDPSQTGGDGISVPTGNTTLADPQKRPKVTEVPPLPPGLVKTRRHGDYRLAQILVAKGDVMLVDFEGEARRPLAQRRAKDLALADVADMLRSLDHAAWASVFRFTEADPVAFDQLLSAALAWRDATRAVFLKEYGTAIAGCACWPGDLAAETLLRLCLLRRLSDEVLREGERRPTTLRIALRGLHELLPPPADAAASADRYGPTP